MYAFTFYCMNISCYVASVSRCVCDSIYALILNIDIFLQSITTLCTYVYLMHSDYPLL